MPKQPLINLDDYETREQAAKRIHRSVAWLDVLLRRGVVPMLRVGRAVRIPKAWTYKPRPRGNPAWRKKDKEKRK